MITNHEWSEKDSMNHLKVYIVAISIFLFACDQFEVNDKQETSAPATEEIGFIPLFYSPEDNVATLIKNAKSDEERERIIDDHIEMTRIVGEMGYVIESEPGWEIAHAAIKQKLKQYESHRFASYMEQVISSEMLKYRLLKMKQEPHPEYCDAVDFYTNLLLRNRNPNAPLLFDALSKLRGYWHDEKIIRAIDSIVRNAGEYLTMQGFSNNNAVDELSFDALDDAKQRVYHDIYYTIPELVNLKDELEERYIENEQ
jgi:hypothetical protein